MANLRTSIALAAYQGERFLSQQLESFVTQSRLPDELCISDDRSTDRTIELVRAFATTAPFPVRFFVNSNQRGANANFENAVTQCVGDVILFSDQDDVWLPRHVEDLVAPMEGDSAIVAVASDSKFVDENLKLTGSTYAQSDRFPLWLRDATMRTPRNQFELVLRHNIHYGHGMAFRRSLLPLMIPFTKTFGYDEWVLLLAAAAGFITYASEPLTLQRQHQNQTAGSRNKDLRVWAAQSKSVSADQERVQEGKWHELLERVCEHRASLPNFTAVERALKQKYDFVVRRRQTRRRPLPIRLALTLRELMMGRYHRFGRGFLAFARDLYGVRPQ
jgi:glycosyltransferase involved in cell wall biosynthesis